MRKQFRNLENNIKIYLNKTTIRLSIRTEIICLIRLSTSAEKLQYSKMASIISKY